MSDPCGCKNNLRGRRRLKNHSLKRLRPSTHYLSKDEPHGSAAATLGPASPTLHHREQAAPGATGSLRLVRGKQVWINTT